LLQVGIDPGSSLGKVRSCRDYEAFAAINLLYMQKPWFAKEMVVEGSQLIFGGGCWVDDRIPCTDLQINWDGCDILKEKVVIL